MAFVKVLFLIMILSSAQSSTADDQLTQLLADLTGKLDSLVNSQSGDTRDTGSANSEMIESFRTELAEEREERVRMEQKYGYMEQRVAATLRGFRVLKLERISLIRRINQFDQNVSNVTEQTKDLIRDVAASVKKVSEDMDLIWSECNAAVSDTKNGILAVANDIKTLETDTVLRIERSMEDVNATIQEYIKTESSFHVLNKNSSIPEVIRAVNMVLPPLVSWLKRNSNSREDTPGLEIPCNTSDACWVTNSECRQSHCACKLLHSYDPGSSRCVTSCYRFGTTFQKAVDQGYISNLGARMPGISAEECRDNCLEATFFTCKSFLYDKNLNGCYLYTEIPTRGNPLPGYDYYQRDCE